MTFKELRESKRFTRPALAERVGVDPKTISFLEDGTVRDPRGSTLLGLAKAFRVSMERVYQAIQNTKAA